MFVFTCNLFCSCLFVCMFFETGSCNVTQAYLELLILLLLPPSAGIMAMPSCLVYLF
jgi:hypothetical protein